MELQDGGKFALKLKFLWPTCRCGTGVPSSPVTETHQTHIWAL